MSKRGFLPAVRKDRHMPWLRRGMLVDVNGKRGVVTGGNSGCNIQVRFEGRSWSSNCHPWWETTYYAADGTVIKDYKKAKVA